MSISTRGSVAAASAFVLFLVLAGPVAATVTPPCSATGTSSSAPDIDLTTTTVWHLKSSDTAGGHGGSTVAMKSAAVSAFALGIGIPIASGSGTGDTAGSVQGVSLSTFAILGRRFVVSGSASGDGGGCSGSIEIILDDVNPVLTALGGGGLLLALIGLLAVVLGARSGGGIGSRILAAVFGGLGGAGLGVALEQFGVLDPRAVVGLGLVVVGALLGLLLTGRFARSA